MRGALLVTLLVLVSPEPAAAWCRMTTSPRQPSATEPCIFPSPDTMPPEQYLEWMEPCSAIALSVAAPSDDLSAEQVAGVLARSIATWEAVECGGRPLGIDLEILADASTCVAPLYRDDAGNVNTIMFVQDWGDRAYDPAAFAVTTVWHRRSTGEILDVDMEINERRGPYGICPPEGCLDTRTVDLENVVTHELGHYLGLAHSSEPDATMYASALAGETIKRDLTADDVAGICAVYPPGRPSGECDFTPRGRAGAALRETGCSVAAPGAPGSRAALAQVALVALALRRRRR
ncbi:MAG: matrixin family metalloprotease [Sandaracinaceae bacterium]|nr:matrixin family metalloprotease [Sandaracinaceae bacterium]